MKAAKTLVVLTSLIAIVAGCSGMQDGPGATAAGPMDETRAIAKEAFVYGFPLVTNYATLYKQAVDTREPRLSRALQHRSRARRASPRPTTRSS